MGGGGARAHLFVEPDPPLCEKAAPPQTYRDLARLQLPRNFHVRLPRSAQQNNLGPTHEPSRKRTRVGQAFQLFAQLRIQNQHRFRPSHRHRHLHSAAEMPIFPAIVMPVIYYTKPYSTSPYIDTL